MNCGMPQNLAYDPTCIFRTDPKKSVVKQQERFFDTVFCKWILFARMTQGWDQGVYLEMGRTIIQTLRDAYWRARRIDDDLVHQKLEKDIRPNDKFYHHVSEQLVERQKQYTRHYNSSFSSTPAYTKANFQSHAKPVFVPQHRNTLLCYGCRAPDHIWRNCPKRFQQNFRSRVAGPA